MFVRRIAVIGTGYVGLTTGACLASLGHHVVCADVDAEKVKRLCSGEVDILEPGLAELVSEGIAAGRLSFVLGAAAAVEGCEVVFLCVPTPMGVGGVADLSVVESVIEEVGALLPAGQRGGQQVDGAGRHRACGRPSCSTATTSPSCRTPSSSARARRCTTS